MMRLFKRLFGSPWKAAWVEDQYGEVGWASYRQVGGIYIVRIGSGRIFRGNANGTTSIEAIPKWWPEVASQ